MLFGFNKDKTVHFTITLHVHYNYIKLWFQQPCIFILYHNILCALKSVPYYWDELHMWLCIVLSLSLSCSLLCVHETWLPSVLLLCDWLFVCTDGTKVVSTKVVLKIEIIWTLIVACIFSAHFVISLVFGLGASGLWIIILFIIIIVHHMTDNWLL